MTPTARRPQRFAPVRQQGFALVVTISLMVLLSLLAVGLLSLSTVTLRSSTQGSLQNMARNNARLSLEMAIGELQKLAGPDQRITSTAAVLGDGESSTSPRPHMTGVWKGWKWDGNGNADYENRKTEDFLGWLRSGPEPDILTDIEYANQVPSGDAIRLVDEDEVETESDLVFADPVSIAAQNGVGGRYAWAVLDQGQKAMVTLPNDGNQDALGDDLAEMTSPTSPAYGAVRDGAYDWSPIADMGDERLKLITANQLELAGLGNGASAFHHLTPQSTALAVDASKGGLARDLSLVFEHPQLPAELDRSFLYADARRPLVNAPSRFRGANVMPSPDPAWRLLHDHARLHTLVESPTTAPVIGSRVTARPPAGTPGSRTLYHPSFTEQQLAPVIAKAQFVFSMGVGASPEQARGQKLAHQKNGENWVLWLVTDPVITLWNPYDVSLEFKRARIDLHRVPLAFQIYRNGRSPTQQPTLFANSYLPGDFGNRKQRYYRLNLEPALEGSSSSGGSIVLKPGEHKVFTAHNHVKHYQQQYMLKGVTLRPGWNLPAGNASNRNVGGISSLNLCVGSNGQSTGRFDGVTGRTIPVKSGDRIQMAVSSAHANIDKFSETDNKEITAFLKYYIDSNDKAFGSTPPLVGGIELDYGNKEAEILPDIPQRELPTFVVPRGLPPQQGDNYVGSNPPPNVRFKEPFLIATLHQKTAADAQVGTRGWLHNAPTNLYSSSGIDQEEGRAFDQYEFSWEPMTDWASSPTVEIDVADRGYGASGIYAQTGQQIAPFGSIPLAPLTSIPQLRHAPINSGGQYPLQTQIVGNSFAHPLIPSSAIRSGDNSRVFLDHSFHANQQLFDRWFFSSASSQSRSIHGSDRDLGKVIGNFLAGDDKLPNPRMRPFTRAGDQAPVRELTDPETGYLNMAAHLGIDGAFNVNSTSIAAWRAMLASLQDPNPRQIDTATGNLGRTDGDGTLVTRHVPPLDNNAGGVSDPREAESLLWRGHRRLSNYEIDELATEIVKQVKLRGPFQSLAEFVNRRPDQREFATSGPLQAAIDASGINDAVLQGVRASDRDPGAAFPEASDGTTSDGAPAFITQADLLTPLAPVITVRSDTFLIRAYGEASNGKDTARARCEATVQRTPEFVDPSDDPTTPIDSLEQDSPNARFGRRFHIIGFRWLSAKEV